MVSHLRGGLSRRLDSPWDSEVGKELKPFSKDPGSSLTWVAIRVWLVASCSLVSCHGADLFLLALWAIVIPSTRMSSQEWPRRCHFLLYKHSAPNILLQQKKQTNSQVHCLLQHWVMPITDFCSRNTELHGRESGVYFVHSKDLFWYLLCCCCNSVMPFFIRKILGDLWVQNILVGSPLCFPQYLHSL